MSEKVKEKIYQLLETIQDEETLITLMEDVAFYSSKQDVVDRLNEVQLKELDEAIREADNNQVITLHEFKKEIGEWKKK
jgi:hypothetical protein